MQDLNRSTEIQYPLLGHFFIFSTISCEEIVYFSKDFSTTFIQYIQRNEVTSGQQVLYRCFHCARLESMYWNSVSTFGALLHFQYHSCEEIIYFSINFSTTFIQCIHVKRSHIGPTGVIPMLSLCKTWIEVLKFSIHFWGTSSFSVPQLWRDNLLFNQF